MRLFKYNKSIHYFYILLFTTLMASGMYFFAQTSLRYIIFALIVLMFGVYSIIRLNHYAIYYNIKKATIRMLIDNITYALGIVYYIVTNVYYSNPTEVNIINILIFVMFLLPSGVGNNTLKRLDKNN